MRVAVITETWAPEINGVAMTLGHLVGGLRALGDEVQVVRPQQDGGVMINGESHVPRHGLPIPGYGGLRFGLPSRYALLARWRAAAPDVVHIATEGPLGWSALQAARQLGLPTTSTFHTNFHTYTEHYRLGPLKKFTLAYLRGLHNRCHCTLVPTKVQCKELQTQGFRGVHVLSRGVDHFLFHPGRRSAELRASWGVKPEQTVMLYVGRLAAEKGLPLLWRAFQAARAVRPELRLVLVGDGPLRAQWEGREGVICAGMRRGEDLATHYASADAFVFASRSETYGNVVPEALASGLPVVAYQQAAAAEILRPGRGGLLVPDADEPAFIDATVELLSNHVLRAQLAATSVDSIVPRSWSAVTQVFRSHLTAAIKTKECAHAG